MKKHRPKPKKPVAAVQRLPEVKFFEAEPIPAAEAEAILGNVVKCLVDLLRELGVS